MKNESTAVVEAAEEGGYFVYCAEVPEANGQGETREDALNNLREAITLVLKDSVNKDFVEFRTMQILLS